MTGPYAAADTGGGGEKRHDRGRPGTRGHPHDEGGRANDTHNGGGGGGKGVGKRGGREEGDDWTGLHTATGNVTRQAVEDGRGGTGKAAAGTTTAALEWDAPSCPTNVNGALFRADGRRCGGSTSISAAAVDCQEQWRVVAGGATRRPRPRRRGSSTPTVVSAEQSGLP